MTRLPIPVHSAADKPGAFTIEETPELRAYLHSARYDQPWA